MHLYSAFSFKDYVFDWQKRKNKNRINLFRSQILDNRINFSRTYNCTFTVHTYLQILFSVKDNCFGLHFPVFNVHLVPTQNYGDVFTDSHQVPVPVWDILVGHSGGNIKHDDATLPLDVVAVSETSKLFLSSCVPHIEADWSPIGVKHQRVHLHAKSS